MASTMEGAVIKVTDNKAIIEIDLTSNLGRSVSGKTTLIATSRGAVKMDRNGETISINLNVYKA